MDPELREAFEGLRRHIDMTAEQLREHTDATAASLRDEIRAGDAETRRHVGVLLEAQRADFRVATEGLDLLRGEHDDTRRRLDRLEARVTRLESGISPGPNASTQALRSGRGEGPARLPLTATTTRSVRRRAGRSPTRDASTSCRRHGRGRRRAS